MSSQPNFNEHYKNLLDQLPPSMKKDVWLRLTNRKNRPLSEEQVRGIHPDIEELLTREVNRYFNKKNRQKIKIEANTSSDGSSTLSRLDGFEKQLEERELCVQQRENNIKKTIDAQVAEERKRLKDEYDALKSRLESEYNNCMLEEQQKSSSADLERQYKSCISTLDKANAVKDKEIGRLSASLSRYKNEIKDLKHVLSSVKKTIKTLDDIIYSKDQTIIAYYDGICSINPDCIDNTIEPTIFYEKEAKVLWTRWHDDAKDDLNIRKKYTFRTLV
ncbi:hypothetical protein GLOIN_2v1878327 [Rhizophagus irregularis DAOM 181602=DAOM 197198]|uniref:Uncharacterized protein n=1 Tax=Rhizophagus irregularis (strain DAOM 181602 / DAOM 197198 / MUCL 43194) TaxID=747089 RepID=A0A2P4PSY0_RHIID|nr:hypothetical protein GLOIN_2v1878327 [Rhizophagus irregularis DAOM 181602=DAOM 197198]POG68479.1 hypothetical protein GLOIN_2v1878327 [Rhizophagus irregularis DAOM 181602=DAOM 197198]|eukprot:XP_025175345.1 hypothetical protein GLOIN_2v1878327 [Rhizophagus irregularis DAOM 181602=DAOM 197198]